MGKPAVFLRLHFCNLECSWCDTKYTWDKDSKEYWQESEGWSVAKTAEAITQYPARRLVVTGGEPLMQQNTLEELLTTIPDWKVEVETNGTIAPSPELASVCQFNVSPKLANSGNSLNRRYKPDVLRKFNSLADANFKFVVREGSDLAEVDQIVEDCGIDSDKVIIMPEGTSQEVLRDRMLALIEEVKPRGYRLLPRLHVMLWGNQRKI